MKKFKRSYDNIITIENLLRAWQEFLSGKKNRIDVAAFQNRLMNNICDLYRELADKTYRHGAYHAFNISDPKPRNIHKATVRDRLLHHLLHAELYSYFDKKFIHDSYSCRIGKGTHKAMDRFQDFGRIVSKNDTRICWVLKCDIRKFFANIDHIILKNIIARHIEDRDLLDLLGHIIDSFSTQGRADVGLPLGNLTSQLLVNVYMNEFDHFMKRTLKVTHYIRYADDFAIFSEDWDYLADLIPQIAEFLGDRLKLSLHPDKVFIKTLGSGVDFLGWIHFPYHRVLRTATKRRMFTNPGIHAADEAVVKSYRGLLSHGNGWKLVCTIEAVSAKF
jgi:RNA-directed DNA polymerase